MRQILHGSYLACNRSIPPMKKIPHIAWSRNIDPVLGLRSASMKVIYIVTRRRLHLYIQHQVNDITQKKPQICWCFSSNLDAKEPRPTSTWHDKDAFCCLSYRRIADQRVNHVRLSLCVHWDVDQLLNALPEKYSHQLSGNHENTLKSGARYHLIYLSQKSGPSPKLSGNANNLSNPIALLTCCDDQPKNQLVNYWRKDPKIKFSRLRR